jgi:RHS repeat-associated protein
LDNTGLYYYGARYYDPTIGRFISPDTVVQNYGAPQTLNRYSYALNNPLRYADPTGHSNEDWKPDFTNPVDPWKGVPSDYTGYVPEGHEREDDDQPGLPIETDEQSYVVVGGYDYDIRIGAGGGERSLVVKGEDGEFYQIRTISFGSGLGAQITAVPKEGTIITMRDVYDLEGWGNSLSGGAAYFVGASLTVSATYHGQQADWDVKADWGTTTDYGASVSFSGTYTSVTRITEDKVFEAITPGWKRFFWGDYGKKEHY